jgi:hypothetical protein
MVDAEGVELAVLAGGPGGAGAAQRAHGGGVAAALGGPVATEAEHVRPRAQPQPCQGRVGAERPAGAEHRGDVRGQLPLGAVELAGADTAVERGPEAFGALGGVLGDVPGDLLGGGLPGAGPADGAHVELAAPHRPTCRVAGDGRDRGGDGHHDAALDGAAVGGQLDGLSEQLGGEALGGRADRIGISGRWGGVQAHHRVEVDQAAQLVLGDLGERHPHGLLQLGQGQAGEAGEVALGVVAGAPPQLGSDRVPQHRRLVVEAVAADRLAQHRVAVGVPAVAAARPCAQRFEGWRGRQGRRLP